MAWSEPMAVQLGEGEIGRLQFWPELNSAVVVRTILPDGALTLKGANYRFPSGFRLTEQGKGWRIGQGQQVLRRGPSAEDAWTWLDYSRQAHRALGEAVEAAVAAWAAAHAIERLDARIAEQWRLVDHHDREAAHALRFRDRAAREGDRLREERERLMAREGVS